ncbi:MAG TPA: betaine--homocysteine S-methyltransferase [Steroidobacteraceae bacterium]
MQTNKLSTLLGSGRPLLADGATGTSLFAMGLASGDAPELWNLEHPERVRDLHRGFVDAGADIILTNSFGGNARRLMLHGMERRARELNGIAAQLARSVADAAGRPVVVAGSVGPTGELFEPLGMLTEAIAVEVFVEQMAGLKDGGAEVAWIETMSSLEEIRAAALAAAHVGLPFTFTASFDTAGRTMMGVTPAALVEFAQSLDPRPISIGANCGVGASDLVMSVLGMTAREAGIPIIAKANAGIPRFVGAHIHYSGTPDLMSQYVHLAVDAGARIVGGCCGTHFDHLAAMRSALDTHRPGPRPEEARVVEALGPLQAPPARKVDTTSPREARRSRRP